MYAVVIDLRRQAICLVAFLPVILDAGRMCRVQMSSKRACQGCQEPFRLIVGQGRIAIGMNLVRETLETLHDASFLHSPGMGVASKHDQMVEDTICIAHGTSVMTQLNDIACRVNTCR